VPSRRKSAAAHSAEEPQEAQLARRISGAATSHAAGL
jgi:hypothetical protein